MGSENKIRIKSVLDIKSVRYGNIKRYTVNLLNGKGDLTDELINYFISEDYIRDAFLETQKEIPVHEIVLIYVFGYATRK